MSGMYQILDNRDKDEYGDIAIIKVDPNRNMVWSTFVESVGDIDRAVEIVTVMNEHQLRLDTELAKDENVISESNVTVLATPDADAIRERMQNGESISFEERQRAAFFIPPDGTTDYRLLRDIGQDCIHRP